MAKWYLWWLGLVVIGAAASTPPGLPIPVEDGYVSYIDHAGQRLTEQRFDSAYAFSEGMAQVELGVQRAGGVFDHSQARWGFIDRTGRLVIAADWESTGHFADGLAPVRREGRWGYVDTQGKVQIELKFLRALPFSEGLAAVELGGGVWNYIDTRGKPVFVPLGADMSDPRGLKDERLVLDLGERTRVVDRNGHTVFEQTGFVRDFSDGLAAFRQESGWGLVDRDGRAVVAPTLPFIWSPKEARVLAQHEGKTGYLDISGQWVIKARFASGNNFSEGLAFVSEGEQFGYINTQGEWQIRPQFKDPMDSASAFKHGRARVQLEDGRAAWIDTEGAIIWSQTKTQ